MSKHARHILVIDYDSYSGPAVYVDGVKKMDLPGDVFEAFQELSGFLEKEGSQGAPLHVDTAVIVDTPIVDPYYDFDDLPELVQHVEGLVRD